MIPLLIFIQFINQAHTAPSDTDRAMSNIQDALGSGYTPYPALDTRLKPGTIFSVSDGVYTIITSDCVEAEPVENATASVNLRSKLSGGVSMQVLGKGGKANLEEEVELKFISPYVSSYESLDFRPTKNCKQKLRSWLAESYHPSMNVLIVHEAFFAQVNGCTKVSGEAGVNLTNRLAASASMTKACDRFSGSNYVVVGYKAETLGTFIAKDASSSPQETGHTTGSEEQISVEGGDLASLLESLETQERQKDNLEERIQEKIDEASAPIYAKAEEEWQRVRTFVEKGDTLGLRALEGYIEAYSDASVVVGSKRIPINIPQLEHAKEELKNHAIQTDSVAAEYETIKVVAGTFQMGCSGSGCPLDAQPLHTVTLSHDFKAMKTEVTQALYQSVAGENPSTNKECGNNCPVDNVSWFDAVSFANALSEKEGFENCYQTTVNGVKWLTGYSCTGWRLPTEAEWEYIARARENHPYSGSSDLQAVAVTREMGTGEAVYVGSLFPNGFGFMDLSGNMFEWCWDWSSQYPANGQKDPLGPKTGNSRVIRGGSWGSPASAATVYARGRSEPTQKGDMLGLRLVKTE